MSTLWANDEDARLAFGELSQRDRLAEALLDENGLRPTDAALDVLLVAVAALDETDEKWDHPYEPVPSISNYAFRVRKAMLKLNGTR